MSGTPGPVSAFLESSLQIRPGEGRRTALLFAHLLLASAVFILGRTVRDTLFLSRYPLQALPWMFVLYGVASAITVILYSRVADRFPRHSVIVASTGVGIATYLAVWGLVRAQADWVYPVFYVWSEVVANLFIVQFWTLANDLHDARSRQAPLRDHRLGARPGRRAGRPRRRRRGARPSAPRNCSSSWRD